MAGPGLYAQTADIEAFLPDVPAAKQTTWAQLIGISSRGIDNFCERPGGFYSDAGGVKYFDVPGDSDSVIPVRSLDLELDFYGATVVKIAERENADPNVASDWVTLAGDGVAPPSDFFFEPANQPYVGVTGDIQKQPYSRIEIPKTSPSTSSTYRSAFMPGKRTLSVNPANWGWPIVPDRIKNVCVKVVIRMYKAQPTGFTGVTGSPDVGSMPIARFLDVDDFSALNYFRRVTAG